MKRTRIVTASVALGAGVLLTALAALQAAAPPPGASPSSAPPAAAPGGEIARVPAPSSRGEAPGANTVREAAAARAVAVSYEELSLRSELPSVRFDVGSAGLRPADRKILDANAEWLRANPAHPVVLEGAADPRGAPDYNLGLGDRRARAVRDYLVASGVAAERIAIVSTGEARRACRGSNCWPLDRRVDFLVQDVSTRQSP